MNMPGLYPPDRRGSPPRHAARANRTPRRESCPMPVPLFDTQSPAPAKKAAARTLARGRSTPGEFILGPEVAAFEAELAAYLGHRVRDRRRQRHRRDRARSCARSASARATMSSCRRSRSTRRPRRSRSTGARPVFCDVDPATFCVTPDTVRAALTPRTKAVLAVHLFGNVAPVARDRGARRARGRGRGAGGRLATRRRPAPGRARHGGDVLLLPVQEPRLLRRRRRRHDRRRRPRRARADAALPRLARQGQTFELVGHNSRLDELQAAILRVLLPAPG